MTDYRELGLEFTPSYKSFDVTGLDKTNHINVLQYLPVNEKAELIQFVVNSAIDEYTGCFSPLRVEIFFAIAICKWYAAIEIEDLSDIAAAYDLLDSTGFIGNVMANIPKDELKFISDLMRETVDDIARYNNSAAGIIQNMSNSSEGLSSNIEDILKKIKEGQGLELLSEIKNVVGTD